MEKTTKWEITGRPWTHCISVSRKDGILQENNVTIGVLHAQGSAKYFGGTIICSPHGDYLPGTGLYYDSREEAGKEIYKLYPPS